MDHVTACEDCPLSKTQGQELSYRDGESWKKAKLSRLYPIVRDFANEIIFVGDYPHLKDLGAQKPRIFSGSTIILIKKEFLAHGIEIKGNNFMTALQCHVNKRPQKKYHRPTKTMVIDDTISVISNKEITKSLKCCRPDINQAISLKAPKLIIPFGDLALRQITGKSGIGKNRGKLVWSEEFNCWVFPMYHPLMVELDQANLPFFQADVAQICQFIKDGYVPKTVEDTASKYRDVESIQFILDKKNIIVSIDTETQGADWCDPNSEIISYSVSDEIGTGYNIWLNQEVDNPSEATHFIWWERKSKITDEKGKTRTITQPTKVFLKRVSNYAEKIKELRELCNREDIKIIMMNGNYDIHRLIQTGITREEIKGYQLDIQTGMHTLDPDNFKNASLQNIQRVLRPERPDYKEVFNSIVDKNDMLKAAKEDPARHTEYACLSKQSAIRLADGSLAPIKDIVSKQARVEVLSLNPTTLKIEPKPVIGWHRVYHKEPVNWLTIDSVINNRGNHGRPFCVYTPDHRILLKGGSWKEVQDLVPGDRIATPFRALGYSQKQIILGSILGDGRLQKRHKNSAASFSMGHCEKQLEYLEWKFSPFKDMGGSEACAKEKIKYVVDREVVSTKFHTKNTLCHPEMTELHDRAYLGNGSATIGDWVYELDVLGLAVWYLDDGTLVNKSNSARIYTLAFTEEEVKILIDMLEVNFNLKAGFYLESSNKKPVITLNKQSSVEFFSLISKYVPPAMRYKIPDEFHTIPFVENLPTEDILPYYAEVKGINPKKYSGKSRGYKYVSYCIDVQDNHNFLTWGEVAHNCADTDSTLDCGLIIAKRLREDPLLRRYYKELVHPVETEIMMDIERNGMLFDLKRLPEVREEVATLINKQEKEIIRLIPKKVIDLHRDKGLRLSRPDLLRDALFSKQGFGLKPLETTPGGEPTLSIKMLKRMRDDLPEDHPAKELLNLHIERGPFVKLYTTYLKGFERSVKPDGRFHPQISTKKTGTGRSSCANPNLQQIPKRHPVIGKMIRNLILPSPGKVFVCADESQSELRFITHESLDPEFLRTYRNGGDAHTRTARMLVELQGHDPDKLSKEEMKPFRQKSKAINFGYCFGMMEKKFVNYARDEYGVVMSLEEATLFRQGYFNLYSKLPDWHERRINEARENGGVRSLFGFFRHTPNILSNDFMARIEAEHAAINTSIQNASNCFVLFAALTMKRRGYVDGIHARLVSFVHDELIYEVDDSHVITFRDNLLECMQNPPIKETFGFELCIPMVAEAKWGRSLGTLTDEF